jgi:hypothetical protein
MTFAPRSNASAPEIEFAAIREIRVTVRLVGSLAEPHLGSSVSNCGLFPLENQFAILRADFDFFSWLELPSQQLRRERVEQVFLNRAL